MCKKSKNSAGNQVWILYAFDWGVLLTEEDDQGQGVYTIIIGMLESSGFQKYISVFHEFPLPLAKKIHRPAAASILMPLTFHIASLDRSSPKFSGVA